MVRADTVFGIGLSSVVAVLVSTVLICIIRRGTTASGFVSRLIALGKDIPVLRQILFMIAFKVVGQLVFAVHEAMMITQAVGGGLLAPIGGITGCGWRAGALAQHREGGKGE